MSDNGDGWQADADMTLEEMDVQNSPEPGNNMVPMNPEEHQALISQGTTPVLLSMEQLDELLATTEQNDVDKKEKRSALQSAASAKHDADDSVVRNAAIALMAPQHHGLEFFSKQSKSGVRDSDNTVMEEAIQMLLGQGSSTLDESVAEISTPSTAHWATPASRILSQPGAFPVGGSTVLLENDDFEDTALSTSIISVSNPEPILPHRTASNTGLAVANLVNEESCRYFLQEAQRVDGGRIVEALTAREKKKLQFQRWGICFVAVCLVVIGVILGVGFGVEGSGTITIAPTMSPSAAHSSMPSSAPTGYLDLLFDDLPGSTQKSLQNSSTPQWKAYNWLSNHQNITNLPEWRKKQLFALATFFYAFEGELEPTYSRKMDG
jgi:hypothetical protein